MEVSAEAAYLFVPEDVRDCFYAFTCGSEQPLGFADSDGRRQ
jgi:hypothetical protein